MFLRRGILNCNCCKNDFAYNDLKIRESRYGPIILKTKICPFCGSTSWSSVEDRKKLGKYIFPNI